MSAFRLILLLSLSLSVGSLWLSLRDELLPSTRASDVSALISSDPLVSATRSQQLWPRKNLTASEPYVPLGMKTIIPLPDNGATLNKTLRGLVWKLAISSQIVSNRNRKSSGIIPKISLLSSNGSCSALCGKHGWGRCRPSGCVCPVIFNTTECLSAISFPKVGPLSGMDVQYQGDITLSRKFMADQSEVLSFIPEKFLDGSKYMVKVGMATSRFLDVLPVSDILRAGKVFDSCALVGSSGVLADYKLGLVIDSHQWVLRFDSAPTRGFEPHVGSRTSLRITNALNWGFLERQSEVVVVPLRTPSSLRAFIRARSKFGRLKLVALNPLFLRHVSLSFEFVPSSEMLGIMVALQRCASVTLFGFHSYGEHSLSDFYFGQCASPPDRERRSKEYEVVAAMVQAGFVKVGDPCTELCQGAKEQCVECQLSHGYEKANRTASSLLSSRCYPCSGSVASCQRGKSLRASSKSKVWNQGTASDDSPNNEEESAQGRDETGGPMDEEVTDAGNEKGATHPKLKVSEGEVIQLALKRIKDVWASKHISRSV